MMTTAWLVSDGRVLASLEVASGRAERRRGLLGRDRLDGALLLERVRWVHTVGMRFPIDVITFDANWTLVGVRTLWPGRVGWPRQHVRHIVETAVGRGQAFTAALDGRTIREALGTGRP